MEIQSRPDGTLSVDIPQDKTKRERIIQGLREQIAQDTNDKDRQIHMRALEALENHKN